MFGHIYWRDQIVSALTMNPFSSGRAADDDTDFDEPDAFVSEHVPEPGPFLEGHDVLEGEAHVAVHETAHDLFEERGVYDATFGYTLARLNLDRRHPDAGYRYALDADDPSVLRAEFSPSTEFCPQAGALITGSFRAWNGLSDRHEYDLVSVRVRPTHHQSESLNESLEELERRYRESGDVSSESTGPGSGFPLDRAGGHETNDPSPF